jgi:hypothetical protein
VYFPLTLRFSTFGAERLSMVSIVRHVEISK